jgi:hypothetical protein
MAGLIIEIRDQAETAGILLVGASIKTPIMGARIRIAGLASPVLRCYRRAHNAPSLTAEAIKMF